MRKLVFLAGLGVLFLYLRALPWTVQTGDSGELVAAGYLLRVPHPSGYPLFVWLVYGFTHLVAWGSVFHRAAVLNALFSVGTLGFLAMTGRHRFFSLAVALCLAFSQIFWRFSEIPEVFSLNSLIAAFLFWVRSRKEFSRSTRTWMITLGFFLGLANHLTILFLAPLVLEAWFLDRQPKRLFASLSVGLAIFVALYASLFAMHPDNAFSWGAIHSPASIVRHFLREDYGRSKSASLSLISQAMADAPKAGAQFSREVVSGLHQVISAPKSVEFRHYASEFYDRTAKDLFPVIAICLLELGISGVRRRRPRGLMAMGCAALYFVVVFPMIKVQPSEDVREMIGRLFLLPQLLLCFAAAEIGGVGPGIAKAFGVIFLVAAGSDFAAYKNGLNFAQNTIIEDYAANFLKMTPEKSPAIILADEDTMYFALRYRQQIFGDRPEVAVVAPTLLFHSWYVKKTKEQIPGFSFSGGAEEYSLENDLIRPNLTQFPFFVSGQFGDSKNFKVTYLPLGRRIDVGAGIVFDGRGEDQLSLRSDPSVVGSDPIGYDPSRSFYSQYAYFDLAKGITAVEKNDLAAAEPLFHSALNKVPYCIPALTNLCILSERAGHDTHKCWEEEARLRLSNFDYYRTK